MRRRGFTLLEMLVALGVFAVVGVMASQILASMVDLATVAKQRSAQFADLQRAVFVVGRDIEQLTRRTVRDEDGDTLDAVLVGDRLLLELTRHGWQNPIDAPRSEVQRVAYALNDDELIRLYWPVLDRAPDTVPIAQKLLGDVREAEFIVHDDLEGEHAFWPDSAAADESEDRPGQLAGIELRLSHRIYGRIERLWLTVPPADFQFGGDAGDALRSDDPNRDDLDDARLDADDQLGPEDDR